MTKEEMIDKIVKTYPHLNKANPCTYGFFNKELSKSSLHAGKACHMSVHWPTNRYSAGECPFDQIITSYPTVKSERDLEFFKFMKTKMYRSYGDFLELLPVNNDQYVLQITDLDKIPANVLYNILICSRAPSEFTPKIDIWWHFVQAGVHPGIAYILSMCTFDELKGLDSIVQYVNSSSGHWCLDNTSDPDLIINGTPTKLSAMYKESPGACTPCNVIWGFTDKCRKWHGKTVREICETHKEKAAASEILLLL